MVLQAEKALSDLSGMKDCLPCSDAVCKGLFFTTFAPGPCRVAMCESISDVAGYFVPQRYSCKKEDPRDCESENIERRIVLESTASGCPSGE